MKKRATGKLWWGSSPSSRKAARRDERKRIINRMRTAKMKTLIKKGLKAADATSAAEAFLNAQKAVMQAASKRVIKLNKASRIVSRLAKKLKVPSLTA